MRRVVVLALLALALPIAALADNINILNQGGTVAVTNSGIVSKGSQLVNYNGITPAPGHALGTVSFTTGALTSGSIFSGGTFSSVGSSFTVIGKNAQVPKGVIFSGTFVGDVNWTFVGTKGNQQRDYVLSGNLQGMLYTGRMVTGQTSQEIAFLNNGQFKQGRGHLVAGSTSFNSPEPGTLGLLGTGLVGIAGMFRRKMSA